MDEQRLLTPREAEAVVEDRIERFGLGALPHVERDGGRRRALAGSLGAPVAPAGPDDAGRVVRVARGERGLARCR